MPSIWLLKSNSVPEVVFRILDNPSSVSASNSQFGGLLTFGPWPVLRAKMFHLIIILSSLVIEFLTRTEIFETKTRMGHGGGTFQVFIWTL